MPFKDVQVVFNRVVEEEVNLCLSHFINMFVLPFRTLILVNKQGANSFEEFSVVHEPLTHLELHLEHVVNVHLTTPLNLLKHNGD